MGNPFVHAELMTPDLGKSKAFYGKLFDWKLEDMPHGDSVYTMIKVGEGVGGGIISIPGAPVCWLNYVLVDDIKAATDKAKSLGANIMKDVTDVGMGWLSIFRDPTGAICGMWQAKESGG